LKISNHIIQWNCRGLKANFAELQRLTAVLNPLAYCIQETHLSPNDPLTVKNFKIFNVSGPNVQRPSGGSAILVKKDIIHSHIVLDTQIQAIAVRITFHRVITLCSIYIPPSEVITTQELDKLVAQLPTPFILMGDFNSHNPLWGEDRCDVKGKRVEDFIHNNDLCLLNDGTKTYLHPGHGTYSAIDLTICSAEIFLDCTWRVWDDLCGSDHFPLITSFTKSDVQQRPSRWQLKKANWPSFKIMCYEKFISANEVNQNSIETFTEQLIDIANETIPKTSSKSHCKANPWFNELCKKAIGARKKAERLFNKHPSTTNFTLFKICRAQARRTINEAKKQSWRQFVSGLTCYTPIKKIWNVIRKMKGIGNRFNIQHIKKQDIFQTKEIDIANTLAESFENNSSIENCLPEFQLIRTQQERKKLNFCSDNKEVYNQSFKMEELIHSLKCSHDTAVGPDKIHYQFLKHLPQSILSFLLDNFNFVWSSGQIPPSWKEATVIPIPKPGKDHTDPNNYRPIALTSCLCKTMERMVNNRLVWTLESKKQISDYQCGFRRGKCTLDQLIRLETYIRDGFIRKEHVVAVFFDLEKAYDTTWRYGILKDLHHMGFRGRLPIFISNFLASRYFKVQVGKIFTNKKLEYLRGAFSQSLFSALK